MLANMQRLKAKRDLEDAFKHGRQLSGKEIYRLTLLSTEDRESARRAEYKYMWEMLRAGRTPSC